MRTLLALLVAGVVLSGLVLSGLLDGTLPGGAGGRRSALASIALYSALFALLAVVAFQWARHRKGIVIGALTLVLALVAFDLVARGARPRACIPKLGNMGLLSSRFHHRYPANQTLRLGAVRGEPLLLRTNEDGFRTHHSRASFAALGSRVAILGDSFAFGLGVPQGVEFPALLEELLREETGAQDLGVLNTGIVSYSPFLQRLLFDDVVRVYSPQLVLVVLDVTDIGDDLRYEEDAITDGGRPVFALPDQAEGFRDPGPALTLARPLQRYLALPLRALGRALGRRPDRGFRYNDFSLELEGVRETNQYFHYRHPLEVTRPYFERTLANLRALATSVEATGSRFAVVVIPRFTHWNTAECPENWERDQYALEEPHQFAYFEFFRAASETVEFPMFDLLSAFQNTDEFPLVLNQDPHWNERGHAFVARELAQELLARGLVPGEEGSARSE
jgi:hypothetical protein